MNINQRGFSSSAVLFSAARRLEPFVGMLPFFEKFHPGDVIGLNVLELLSTKLFFEGICCFITGSFINFTAGVYSNHGAAALFIAEKDAPLLRVMFQRGPGVLPRFIIGGIRFELSGTYPHRNIYIIYKKIISGYIYLYLEYLLTVVVYLPPI
jgi:hypothetical protein